MDRTNRREARVIQNIFDKTLNCLDLNYILFLWDESRNVFNIKEFPTLTEIFLIYAREDLKTEWKNKAITVGIRREGKTFFLSVSKHDPPRRCEYLAFTGHIHLTNNLQNLTLFKIATSIQEPEDVEYVRMPASLRERTFEICRQYKIQKYGSTTPSPYQYRAVVTWPRSKSKHEGWI